MKTRKKSDTFFNVLPNELSSHAFAFLSFREASRIAATCKKGNELIKENYWFDMYHRYFHDKSQFPTDKIIDYAHEFKTERDKAYQSIYEESGWMLNAAIENNVSIFRAAIKNKKMKFEFFNARYASAGGLFISWLTKNKRQDILNLLYRELIRPQYVFLENWDQLGRSLLHWAAICNQPRKEVFRIFKLLANEDLPLNFLESGSGQYKPLLSALGEGVKHGHIEFVKSYLDLGGDVNVEDSYGRNALVIAIWCCNDTLARFLIERNININKADMGGHTPVMEAFSRRRYSIAEMLVTKGARLDVTDLSGHKTVLHLAITEYAELSAIEGLMKLGLNPNARDDNGETPFSRAAMFGRKDIVKFILDSGKVSSEERRRVHDHFIKKRKHSIAKLVGLPADQEEKKLESHVSATKRRRV